MYVKLRKCKFAQREIRFLGHVVSPDGLAIDTDKVAVVSAWPVPDSAVQLRKFLGLGNYFRKFVQGYSSLARPLNALLGKGVVYKWTVQCQYAFEGLKRVLITAPVLAMPDFSDDAPDFFVWCDASDFALGAVLI
jgi:hypothetical protein